MTCQQDLLRSPPGHLVALPVDVLNLMGAGDRPLGNDCSVPYATSTSSRLCTFVRAISVACAQLPCLLWLACFPIPWRARRRAPVAQLRRTDARQLAQIRATADFRLVNFLTGFRSSNRATPAKYSRSPPAAMRAIPLIPWLMYLAAKTQTAN